MLDEAQQRQVLASPLSAFDDDRANGGSCWPRHITSGVTAPGPAIYADSARIADEELLRAAPEDAQRHVFLGVALAYLGRKADAVREGQRGVALLPIARTPTAVPTCSTNSCASTSYVGEPEKALDQLEPLLKVPYYLSPGWLRIDPTFDPLRKNPRFMKLVEGTA